MRNRLEELGHRLLQRRAEIDAACARTEARQDMMLQIAESHAVAAEDAIRFAILEEARGAHPAVESARAAA